MRTKRTSSENDMRTLARVGLVLIFTLLLSIFMYEGWYKPKFVEAAPTANGNIIYNNNNTTPPVYRTFTPTTFGAQTNGAAAAINLRWFVNKASHTRNEHIAGYVTSGGVLYIGRWNGTTWSAEWNVTVGGNGVDGRRFDIAYEQTLGRAMVVYSTNTNGNAGAEMAYRIWDGATWTGAVNLPNSARLAQAAPVAFVKLASRPGSNEIAVMAADTGTTTANTATFTAFIWSGSAWGNEPGTTFGTTYNTTGQLFQNELFDLAYESLSGDLFTVFTNATPQQNYRTYSGGTWSAVTSFGGTGRAAPIQMVAISDPQSDQIVTLWNRSGSTNVYGTPWTGTAPIGTITAIGANGGTVAINQRTITGKWVVVGGVSYAVAIWNSSTAGTIGYNYFISGGTWGTAATQSIGATASTWMDTDVDVLGGRDTLMLTTADTASDLWADQLRVTPGPVFTWTSADGGTALNATLGSITSQNFSFAYDMIIPSTLTIGDGTPAFPLAPTVYRNELNRAVDEFTLSASGANVTVTSIVVTATTGTNNVGSGCVHLFVDTNGNHIWDAGDLWLADSTFVGGSTATFNLSGSPITINDGTSQTYIVTYDIASTAVPTQTINGSITSVTSNAGTTVNNDNTDATMTVGTMTLTVTDLPNPASKSAQQGSINNAVAKFTLSTNAGTANVSSIVITATTGTAFVQSAGVDLWIDVNGDNEWDAGDTLVAGNVSFSGTTATFTSPPIDVTTTPVGYLVTYNITSTATVGQTTNGYISSIASDANVNTNNDNTVDATLTISAGTCVRNAPDVQITPSSAFVAPSDSTGYTVTVTNNDSSFCANSTWTIAQTNTPAVPNVHYSSSVLGSTSTGGLAPGGSYQTTLTLSTTATATVGTQQQSYVTISDGGVHTAKQSNTVLTTVTAGWAQSTMLHNSITLASSAWTGSWGVPNGKYGAFVCSTCHDRKTGNIKRIKQAIVSESTHTWPNGSTTTGPISFTSATAGSSNFGKTAAPWTGVCNVCHSPTYHTFYSWNSSNGHEASNDCTACHKHNKGFSGDGPCTGCHASAQSASYTTRQIVGGTTGNPGDDFIRLSRHVTDGTANSIVTPYDCVICHAEGDANKVALGTGWLDKTMHTNGTTSRTRMVKLRNVDNITQTYDFNKWILSGPVSAATTTMRNNMDTFCMNCHDANGASGIAVNNTNNGLILGTPTTTTVRVVTVVTGTNANPNNVTVNLRPFNTNDNLRNGRDAAWTAGTTGSLGAHRTSTYGRVLNVKDQFNSTNQVGKNWASHHNLNQFTKRYSTRNTTAWPAASLTAYVTKQGVTMNAATGGEIAGLHCSDCHLNETNAHGARNAWYMNQSKDTAAYTPGNEPDITPTTTGQATQAGQRMCFRCHNATVYASDATAATNARYDHTLDCAASSVGSNATTQVFGATCFACHGATSATLDGTRPRLGLGAIHGNNDNYNPANGATASKRYRFMAGGSMRFYNPNDAGYTGDASWEGTGDMSCYTVSATTRDVFGGCTTHGSQGRAEVVNRARALQY